MASCCLLKSLDLNYGNRDVIKVELISPNGKVLINVYLTYINDLVMGYVESYEKFFKKTLKNYYTIAFNEKRILNQGIDITIDGKYALVKEVISYIFQTPNLDELSPDFKNLLLTIKTNYNVEAYENKYMKKR